MRSELTSLTTVLMMTMLLVGMGYARSGETDLDNDPGDTELFFDDEELAAGQVRTTDDDDDGDFDTLTLGIRGGGEIFGWSEFDGRSEMEIVVSDPTLPSGQIRLSDADGDGDAEVIWVGTRGLDLDGDGVSEPEENGLLAGFADIDGDGDLEIIVMDKTRALGEHLAKGFGIDRSQEREILWVGVLDEELRTTIGTFAAIQDIDSDGDDEVIFQDLRRPSDGATEFGSQLIDIDGDEDPDLIIERP